MPRKRCHPEERAFAPTRNSTEKLCEIPSPSGAPQQILNECERAGMRELRLRIAALDIRGNGAAAAGIAFARVNGARIAGRQAQFAGSDEDKKLSVGE